MKKLVSPSKLTQNGLPTSCSRAIANILNKHFTSIAQKLSQNLPPSIKSPQSFLRDKNPRTMFLDKIEMHEILEEIQGISDKKAMGHDNIPPKVIKWAPHIFAPILLVIFNKCIEKGYYPDAMKIARVVPIHKGGDTNDVNNYRPISILTQFNRIFERILSQRLLSFFEKYNIITSKQFGFLKKHSTEHAILDLKEYILANLDKRKISAVLFLDLQKAFDTVSHDILLTKLFHYGVRGAPLNLLTSYLTDRKQFTVVDGVKSDLESVLWGVPQGSVLGPLLFILYINDLPKSCKIDSWLFADDTALAESSETFSELNSKMNAEINKVHDWLIANKLSVHYAKKTQFILFIPKAKSKEKPDNFLLKMGEHIIEQTTSYKYLGVLIDENLNWTPQIDKMCAKLSSVCGILSKVRHYLNRNSLMLIYNSLVESRLRYSILSWSTAPMKQINRLKVLQNKALRFINFSSLDTAMLPLYAHFNVLPLDHLILLQQVTHMFSLHNNLLPKVFDLYCTRPSHSQGTRFAKSNYVFSKCQTKLQEKSMKAIGPRVWASVPHEAKLIPFKKSFTRHMKNEYIKSLPTEQSTGNHIKKKTETNEMYQIFMNDSTDSEFFGFDLDLDTIFASESDHDFLGF